MRWRATGKMKENGSIEKDGPSTRKVHRATELQQGLDGRGWQMQQEPPMQGSSSGSHQDVITVQETGTYQ